MKTKHLTLLITLFLLITSCTDKMFHNKHYAIYHSVEVQSKVDDLVLVKSPSMSKTVNHTYFTIFYPYQADPNDNLTFINTTELKLYSVVTTVTTLYVLANNEVEARLKADYFTSNRYFDGDTEEIMSISQMATTVVSDNNILLLK